jgi:hypothetical protein
MSGNANLTPRTQPIPMPTYMVLSLAFLARIGLDPSTRRQCSTFFQSLRSSLMTIFACWTLRS